jgi:threonine dehydrogenase-like Zn-dependent dehydrogenase
MKRLVCEGVGKIGWQEVEEQPLAPNQVRVRSRFGVEKHGTMMAFYKGYANERGRWDGENRIHIPEGVLWDYPIPLGNMQMGEVIEVGTDVTRVKVGDTAYSWAPFQPRFVASEDRLRLFPDPISWQSGMLMDPGEFAVGAVRDGNVRIGERVAVFGMGAIGLVVVQAVRAAGAAQIIAIDPLENRRQAALECGADVVLNPVGADIGMQLRDLTGLGVDVAIDYSGNVHALQAAIRGVAYGGTVVLGAYPAPYPAGLDFGGEAHMNRPRFIFSRANSDPNPEHPRWDWRRLSALVELMIARGDLKGEPIVDEPLPFESLLETYEQIASNLDSSIKFSIKYE